MLLLCAAIVLVLGVIFYDSIPSNKVVPNKLVAYTTPENIQTEIDEQITEMDMNKIEVTYEITASDLNLYKQTHSYTPGKPDPFSASTSTNVNNTTGGGTGNQTNTNNGSTTNSDPNSTNTFFNNTGLK